MDDGTLGFSRMSPLPPHRELHDLLIGVNSGVWAISGSKATRYWKRIEYKTVVVLMASKTEVRGMKFARGYSRVHRVLPQLYLTKRGQLPT